jgi:hypothetical protein
MKNFGKLTINTERLMNNEELLNLRGGQVLPTTTCHDAGNSSCSGACSQVNGGSTCTLYSNPIGYTCSCS